MSRQRRGGAGMTASLTAILAHRKGREALGVLLVAAALFTLVSLASYDPADPSFFHSGLSGAPARNAAGWAGAHLAGALFGLAGAVALVLPPGLLLLGVRTFTRPSPVRFSPAGITGAALGTLSLCLLLALLQREVALPGLHGEPLGGVLGQELLRFLMPVLGRFGLTLVAVTALALATILLGRLSLVALPLRLAEGGARALRSGRALLAAALGTGRGRDRQAPAPAPAATTAPAPSASAAAPARRPEAAPEAPAIAAPPPEPIAPVPPVPVPRAHEAPQETLPFIGPEVRYTAPPLSLLDPPEPAAAGPSAEEHQRNAEILVKTLRDFGVETRVADVSPGPVITRYEVEPGPGIKINRIVGLADDLALALKTMSVRVVAPIPGKAVVGVEIPNQNRARVSLREILGTPEFASLGSPLPLALGKDIAGNPMVADLTQMPHLLIAGATGSGKSVCLNGLILSILVSTPPTDVQVLLIDPKRVELSIFNGIPHLLDRVVVEAREAAKKLQLVIAEMERRYRVFAEVGARNLTAYNQWAAAAAPAGGEDAPDRLPHLVVLVDELADLMLVAAHDVENAVARLAQMARAVGIHLIVATQRPSVDVITGVIKANFPARISFQVSSKVDSRTILDVNGAEQLLGSGDMLFLPPTSSKPVRIHGCFVSEVEIRRVVKFLGRFEHPATPPLPAAPAEGEREAAGAAEDPLYEQARELVIQTHQASISMLQRRLRVGFNRAARLLDQMERDGIVSPMDGPRPREVLVKPAER